MTQHDDDKCEFEADIYGSEHARNRATYFWNLLVLAIIVIGLLLATVCPLLRYVVGA